MIPRIRAPFTHGIATAFVLLWLSLSFAGCAGGSRSELAQSETPVEINRDSLLMARADSLMAGLSLRERAGMLIMPSIYTRSDASTLRKLTEYALTDRVGGIVLLKGDTLSARIIADTLRRMGRQDCFLAIDAEWGLRMRLADAPEYPDNRRLGLMADSTYMDSMGAEIARQCRRLGINMVLGPVVDVLPEEGNAFLDNRSFGKDARQVSRLATSYSRALERGGVISVAKHFPGHGSAQTDSHKGLPVLYRSLHALDSCDLVPFRSFIASDLSAIMVGHLAVASIDTEEQSATISPGVVGDLLRRDLGFRGLVITDALNMGGAGDAEAWQAIAAGADLVLSPLSTAEAIDGIVAAVSDGRLSEKDLNDRCRRVLFYMLKFRIIN